MRVARPTCATRGCTTRLSADATGGHCPDCTAPAPSQPVTRDGTRRIEVTSTTPLNGIHRTAAITLPAEPWRRA